MTPPPDTICITENCGKARKWKGLCSSCYGCARRLIDEGKATWDSLQTLGLVLIDDKPFIAAFKKKVEAAGPATLS